MWINLTCFVMWSELMRTRAQLRSEVTTSDTDSKNHKGHLQLPSSLTCPELHDCYHGYWGSQTHMMSSGENKNGDKWKMCWGWGKQYRHKHTLLTYKLPQTHKHSSCFRHWPTCLFFDGLNFPDSHEKTEAETKELAFPQCKVCLAAYGKETQTSFFSGC